jgi:eukaryotic-like serine/threonine-protein kinase
MRASALLSGRICLINLAVPVASRSIGLITGVLAVRAQARRAEHRFQQVRKLAKTVLFDLNGEIENLAGATKARELLVKTSLEYLDSLAGEASNDTSLRLEVATAYEKIGDVQGNQLFSNLGRPRDSLESYAKALAIGERLGLSQAALELMARTYSKMGSVYNFALGRPSDAEEKMRLAIRLADQSPPRQKRPLTVSARRRTGFLGEIVEAGTQIPLHLPRFAGAHQLDVRLHLGVGDLPPRFSPQIRAHGSRL